MVEAVKLKQTEREQTVKELEQFNSEEGQRVTKLDNLSKDTGVGWRWLQDHKDEFEKEVYGPPLVTCSIKDSKYVDLMEALFSKNDMITFTVQTSADYKLLRQRLVNERNLADIGIKQSSTPLSEFPRPRYSDDAMLRYGFDHWALDLIDGPEPVVAMLCHQLRLHNTAVGKNETSESQHAMILESGITSWATGTSTNRYIKRAEYGPGATTVSNKAVFPAQQWSNSSIDVSKRDEIQARIDGLAARIAEMKVEAKPVRDTMDSSRKAAILKRDEEVSSLRCIRYLCADGLQPGEIKGGEKYRAKGLCLPTVPSRQNW